MRPRPIAETIGQIILVLIVLFVVTRLAFALVGVYWP